MVDTEALMHALGAATDGLLFPSESDFPIEPYRFGTEEPTADVVLRALGRDEGTTVEIADLESFFEGLLEEPGFQRLKALLEGALADVRVLRVGKVDVEVLVLGRTPSGEWLGVRTKAVET